MSITTAMRSALGGLGVEVLKPSQHHLPHEWQEEGPDGELLDGERTGIMVYLEQHAPEGYLQIEPSFAQPALDWLVTRSRTLAAIAVSEERALELAQQAYGALCGTPEAPGPYNRIMTEDALYDPAGFYIVRNTYTRLEMDGHLAG